MMVGDKLSRLLDGPLGWIHDSAVIKTFAGVAAAVERSFRSSRVFAAGVTVERWVRNSYVYRWLTAEPEPEVIVIDLRETYVIGPFIAVADALLELLVEAWQNSTACRLFETLADATLDAPARVASLVVLVATVAGLALQFILGTLTGGAAAVAVVIAGFAALGTRIDTPWSELRETRAVRLLAAAFEPPPPPEGFESAESVESDPPDSASDAGVAAAAEPAGAEPVDAEPVDAEPAAAEPVDAEPAGEKDEPSVRTEPEA